MITECPECKKEMSSTAKQCPHCGYKKPMSFTWLWWTIGAVVAFLTFGAVVGSSPEMQEKTAAKDKIAYCWEQYNKKTTTIGEAQIIEGACQLLEQRFYDKYGHKP